MLDAFGNMLQFFIASSSFTPIMECLQTLRWAPLSILSKCVLFLQIPYEFLLFRRVVSTYHRKCSAADEIQLVKFLLRIIESLHSQLSSSSHSTRNQSSVPEVGKRKPIPRHGSLWEVQTVAFTMLGETISRAGSSFPVDIWKSTIEVAYIYSFTLVFISIRVYIHSEAVFIWTRFLGKWWMHWQLIACLRKTA